jgi:hypothetical protein
MSMVSVLSKSEIKKALRINLCALGKKNAKEKIPSRLQRE